VRASISTAFIPAVKPDFTKLRAPVLGIFAEKDEMVNAQAVKALEEQLKAAGKRYTFHTYPNTTHAFFNDTRPEVYDAKAALDAWNKTLEFFKTELA
jgi:carboxymethylenebutenolidase